MTTEQIAVALFEAIQDRKKTAVIVYNLGKSNESYFLQIGNTKHPVNKAIAINAMKWKVSVEQKFS
jgi:hypothetical protein